jgi:negative regulator of flagellin synthesis FlgM
MKIDGSNPFPETQSATFRRTNTAPGTESNEVSGTAESDGASLSTGSSVSALAAQLQQMPDVRQDRVAALKQAIQSGNYQVSDEQIADALHAQVFGSSTE